MSADPTARGRLAGKTALITGASRGIGRAVAVRFAAEGATVAINYAGDRNGAEAALAGAHKASRAAGHRDKPHRVVAADVTSTEAVAAMFASVIAAFGRLDVLVNNAGTQAETPGEAYDDALLARIVAVNLMAAAACAKAALAHFVSRPGGGVIINTSSVHERIPKPAFLAYSISKGGLGNLTRTLALEFAGRGIRVNGIGPGATLTSMNARWKDDAEARAAVESHIPLGYAAAPEDIAPAYVFLASDEARYITGQTLYVCGGLTLYPEFRDNWAS